MKKIAFLLLPLIVVLLLAGRDVVFDTPDDVGTVAAHSQTVASLGGGGATVGSISKPEFQRQLKWRIQGDFVAMSSLELNPVTLQEEASYREYSTSWDVHDVASRAANDFFVGGMRDGKVIFEWWRIPKVDGWYSGDRPLAQNQVGVPEPYHDSSYGIEGGGAYEPVASRRHPPAVRRTHLYSGTALSSVSIIAPDPYGRHILIYSDAEHAISVLETDGSSTPQVLYDSTQLLNEAGSVGAISVFRHAIGGLLYVVSGAPGVFFQDVSVIKDSNNDGIVDAYEFYPDGTFEQSYPISSLIDVSDGFFGAF